MKFFAQHFYTLLIKFARFSLLSFCFFYSLLFCFAKSKSLAWGELKLTGDFFDFVV